LTAPINASTRPAIRLKEPKNGTPGPVNASVNPWRARAEHVAHVLPTLLRPGVSLPGGSATRTPVRKRFTYWTLRRRVSGPVTHHGLDGFVTLLIADARNARFSRPAVGSVVGVAEVVQWAAIPLGIGSSEPRGAPGCRVGALSGADKEKTAVKTTVAHGVNIHNPVGLFMAAATTRGVGGGAASR